MGYDNKVEMIHPASQVHLALTRMPGVDGFFGASSVERLPTERATRGRVQALKGLKVTSRQSFKRLKGLAHDHARVQDPVLYVALAARCFAQYLGTGAGIAASTRRRQPCSCGCRFPSAFSQGCAQHHRSPTPTMGGGCRCLRGRITAFAECSGHFRGAGLPLAPRLRPHCRGDGPRLLGSPGL
jgi:hypothetical protein